MRKRQVVLRGAWREESSSVRYGECQKNHAAATGGYSVDGCREFMASADDAALYCAACGCHRNFHRRELVSDCNPPPRSNGN